MRQNDITDMTSKIIGVFDIALFPKRFDISILNEVLNNMLVDIHALDKNNADLTIARDTTQA